VFGASGLATANPSGRAGLPPRLICLSSCMHTRTLCSPLILLKPPRERERERDRGRGMPSCSWLLALGFGVSSSTLRRLRILETASTAKEQARCCQKKTTFSPLGGTKQVSSHQGCHQAFQPSGKPAGKQGGKPAEAGLLSSKRQWQRLYLHRSALQSRNCQSSSSCHQL
jgi:hypothetical protein